MNIYNILPPKKLFLKMKYSKRGFPYYILFYLTSGLFYNLWFLFYLSISTIMQEIFCKKKK